MDGGTSNDLWLNGAKSARYVFSAAFGEGTFGEDGGGINRLLLEGYHPDDAAFLVVEVGPEGVLGLYGGAPLRVGESPGLLISFANASVLIGSQFGAGAAPVEFAVFEGNDGVPLQVALFDLDAFL